MEQNSTPTDSLSAQPVEKQRVSCGAGRHDRWWTLRLLIAAVSLVLSAEVSAHQNELRGLAGHPPERSLDRKFASSDCQSENCVMLAALHPADMPAMSQAPYVGAEWDAAARLDSFTSGRSTSGSPMKVTEGIPAAARDKPDAFDFALGWDWTFIMTITVLACLAWHQSRRARNARSAERRLQENEPLLKVLFDEDIDSQLILDGEGVIQRVNRRTCDILQRTHAELIGRHFTELSPAEGGLTRQECSILLADLPAGASIARETLVMCNDGSTLPIEMRATPFYGNGDRRIVATLRDISERVQMNEALRDSEEVYRRLMEASPDAIFHATLQGEVLRTNQQMTLMFGHDSPKIGHNAIEFVVPEEQELARRNLSALLTDNVHHGNEYTLVRDDGTRFPGEVSTALVRTPDGRPHSVIGVTRDVTVRKQAELAIARARVFLERLVNALPTPVFVKDRGHRLVLVNDALCELLGQERGMLIGRTDYNLVPKAQADVFVEKDKLVFATGRENINEELLRAANGEDRVLVTRKALFQDFDGDDVLVGVINDITDRKRMEEQLRLSAQVFDHSTEAMFVSDERNSILSVNRAFTEITGYSADEVVGKNPSMLSSGQHAPEFYQQMWSTLVEHGYWQGELINRRKSGALFPEWLKISAVRDDSGQVRRYIALFSDITERKTAEERIRTLAHHDALTGLPNRSLLRDRVEQALLRAHRTRKYVALMMLDLDRFKGVNDTLGHQAGDELLKQVAARLRGCVRESDTVSRLGGDEFVILLAETDAPGDAEIVARKILIESTRSFTVGQHEAYIGASIGISVFPKDGTDPDWLLRKADEAMYRVKKHGRNGFAFAQEADELAA